MPFGQRPAFRRRRSGSRSSSARSSRSSSRSTSTSVSANGSPSLGELSTTASAGAKPAASGKSQGKQAKQLVSKVRGWEANSNHFHSYDYRVSALLGS